MSSAEPAQSTSSELPISYVRCPTRYAYTASAIIDTRSPSASKVIVRERSPRRVRNQSDVTPTSTITSPNGYTTM